ncbi:hypothetical protein PF008_g3092 [Phytophthora fragariae]|uniref:Uncharacterized protein n=1 Tax=Phytophthora fragariae TaxID=53985 RepID=A0A6G0SF78_9STRA|nr:hypothetical protein PF003_g31156 [Phytophthora fragariae]KAE9357574.1 hypothetical protein PF008_g3092 [Phytophthora fragariae]
MQPRRSYAAAVRSSTRAAARTESADTGATPVPLSGRWRPRERQLLLATLHQDWNASSTQVLSEETAQLRQIALADTELHQDHALRQRTALETKALLAYLHGDLELPHAPTFLKATMPLLQRAMLEQFHETHMEVTLTADVSPRAKLRRNMTHIALFAQLYEANADSERGRQMIDKMMDDVKMLHFDGIHTLHFVFTSGRVARSYLGLAFRLQGVVLNSRTPIRTPQLEPSVRRNCVASTQCGSMGQDM